MHGIIGAWVNNFNNTKEILMNNKFVCSFVLLFTSSLVASENSQKITALITTKYLNTSRKDEVSSYKMLRPGIGLESEGLTQQEITFALQNKKEYEVKTIQRDADNYWSIEAFHRYGIKHNIVVVIEDKDNVFHQTIKNRYNKEKEDKFPWNKFLIHFLKEEPNSVKLISLELGRGQVEELISLKKPSAMRLILAGLGVAGLIAALVCYFNHSKCMTLLQRS